MGCDVCSKEILRDTGYMLSTTQAITNPRYWEYFFRHYYTQQVEYLGRNGEKLGSYVFGRAADNTGWALCESCIQMYSINKSKAHEYFKTWKQTGRLPSDFGTADFGLSFDAAKKGWKSVFGTEPRLDAKDPALPFAASIHAVQQVREIKAKKGWKFWKR